MRKLLVITEDALTAEALARLGLSSLGFDGVEVNQADASLLKFLEWEPTHVLVLEYYGPEAKVGERFQRGRRAYADIKAAAQPGLCIVRSGWLPYDFDDYLRLPFSIEGLKTAFCL